MIVISWPRPWTGIVFLAVLVSVAAPALAQGPGADRLLQSLRWEQNLELCGESVPLHERQTAERLEKEMLVSLGNRAQVILWLKRTTRFFPYIEQVLKENGLPDDLKYLAIAESALRRHAGSRKGAMGVWQLMPQTARKYGLRVNSRIDERRSFVHSTPAAVTYLKALYARFGSWTLSLAAYNMGEEGLEAEMLEQGVGDYYRLYLPLETQRFVFRILAIKLIVHSPHQYGFQLAADDYYPPVPFTTVPVDVLSELALRLVAQASKTDFKTIKELNPQIRGHYLATGTYRLHLPPGSESGFLERLTDLAEKDNRARRQRLYRVKEGDSLSGIADKFDVPLPALLIWNRMRIDTVIHPGQQVVVLPNNGVDKPAIPSEESSADD